MKQSAARGCCSWSLASRSQHPSICLVSAARLSDVGVLKLSSSCKNSRGPQPDTNYTCVVCGAMEWTGGASHDHVTRNYWGYSIFTSIKIHALLLILTSIEIHAFLKHGSANRPWILDNHNVHILTLYHHVWLLCVLSNVLVL